MKIYNVVCYDNDFSWYYYGTKKEALKAAADFRKEYKDGGIDSFTIDIEPIEIIPTRAGIADALQQIVTNMCANEH